MGNRKRDARKREKASDKGTTDQGHGLKNTLHGITYQLKLLILILLQAAEEMKKNKKFKCSISTEDPEYGKFDDIVFRFTNDDLWYLLCIQAKHKKDATESITRKDLISTSNDSPYSISKYFDSYTKSKLLQQKTDGTEKTNSPAPTLVLCTNIGLEPTLVKDLMVDEKHSFEDSLLSSFFNSLKSKTYKFDFNKIKNNYGGKLIDSLKKNSDFRQLAKQLAECIFNREIVNFHKPLFARYRGFIQNKIATNDFSSEETKNAYKVNEDFFNEEFKKDFETEYLKLIKQGTKKSTKQEPNRQDVWGDVKSKGIQIDKVTETNETILPKKIEQSEIENFFKSFIIATNTLNESELSGLIVEKLNNSGYLPPDTQKTIVSKVASDQLSQWILEWTKDKDSKPLKQQEIKKFFKWFVASLEFLHLERMSKDYCSEIQKFKLKCKPEILKQRTLYQKLDPWLSESGNGGHKVDIWKSNEPSWVVLNTLELCKSNLTSSNANQPMSAVAHHPDGLGSNPNQGRELNYLVFADRKFRKSKKSIMNAFIYTTIPLILVVKCKSTSNIKSYIEEKVEGKSTTTIKKIILISYDTATDDTSEATATDDTTEATATDDTSEATETDDNSEATETDDASEATAIDDTTEATAIDDTSQATATNDTSEATAIDDTTEATAIDDTTEATAIDDTSDTERDLLFRDLTDECRKQIINQTNRFFGTEISTSELFHDKDQLNFVLDVLQHPSETGMKCNMLKKSYEKIKDVFIQRSWQRCNKKEPLKIFHNLLYQESLMVELLLQGANEIKQNKQFECSISTEDSTNSLFDEIVFNFTYDHQCFHFYIQAKHIEDDTKCIRLDDLISTSKKNPYSVYKYFNSYITKNSYSSAATLVLGTNIGLAQEVKDLMVDAKQSLEGSLVGSFFESLKSDIYTFDFDKIKKKDDGKLLESLTENSDFKQLTKQLAECIFKQETVDCRKPLFKRYCGFIQNKIATNDFLPKGKQKFYMVNYDFFYANKEFTKHFEEEYQKLIEQGSIKQETNRQAIWSDIQLKGIRVRKEQLSKLNEETNTFVPKRIEQSQIRNFFNSFIIAANAFKESSASILKALSESSYILPNTTTIVSKFANDHLSNRMLEWIKQKESLKEQDIKEIFVSIAASLWFLHFEGISNDYCEKLQNLRLERKTEILQQRRLYKTLDRWLSESDDGWHKVDILKCNDPSWFVYDTLELCKSNLTSRTENRPMYAGDGLVSNPKRDRNLTYLFFEDGQFEKSKRYIMKVFIDITFPLILVVKCKQNLDIVKCLEEWVEGMLEKKHQSFKKIILVGKMISASEFEGDLTDKLSNKKQMKCDKLKESNDKIKEIQIYRDWELSQKELRETPRTNFWSTRKEGTTLTKLFAGIGAENDISYETFLDCNNEMFNFQLYGNRQYTLPPGVGEKTQDQVQSNSYDLYENFIKAHVIFNEAGSGKSFYLTWLASYLQDRSPSWWIIKFNLNEYGNEFGQLQKRGELETMDELITIRFLFQLVYLVSFIDNMFDMNSNEIQKKSNNAREIAKALEFSYNGLKLDKNKMKPNINCEELVLLRIFVHKFNSKQIVILMDGFDEIAPYYEPVVLNLLSTLKTFDGICKLYLSSRPYGLRNKVETALKNCACYRLVEFNQQDQYSFIGRYILKHFDAYKSSDDAKQKRIFCVVFAILTEILGDLMKIPLFLSMGIDFLMSEEKICISIQEEKISKQIIEDCGHSFEPLSMVEHFVEKKLDIRNMEKKGKNIASSKTVADIDDAKEYRERVKETHSLLALYTIMSKDDIEELLSVETQETALRYMENVRNGSEKLGLFEGVIDNTPIFNHRLFGEFFVALWFYKNKSVPGVKDFLKREVYETNRRIEIRQFLDRMICRESPLHMAVLDGSKSKMKKILSKNSNFLTERDDWGRTPLQLSFLLPRAEGNREIVEFLLNQLDEKSVKIQDTYFEWFLLDYAYCADILIQSSNRKNLFSYNGPDWHWVVTLLNKGASIDTPEMLSRFSTKEHFMIVVDVLIIELFTERNYTPNFETFFTKLFKKLGSDKVLNLEIPIDATYKDFSGEKLGSKVFSTLNQHIREMVEDFSSSIPILEFCIMIDSVMSKIIIENSNGFKLKRPYEYYFELALKCRSINVLQYLITSHREYLKVIKDNFERELWELLAYLQNDEQEFKSLFHEYCTRHDITCHENTQLQSKEWKRGFSSRQDLMVNFPTKFERRDDTGVDSGTEFLIARALQLDNAFAVKYLLHKSITNLDNRFIRQIYLNCKAKWCCQSSYHFLLGNCIDLTGTDENGRNLLQFAVAYGDLILVKCLMEHYNFKPTKINFRENEWNAFFYCASFCEWDDDNSKNIFVHMLDKDPVDCFSQLDAKEKNVFYYAARNNRRISNYIIQRRFEKQLEDLNSDQIDDLIEIFKKSSLNAKDMLEHLQEPHLNDETKCKSICATLESIDELRYQDEKGRNLLHIAIMKGWFVLGKCFIEDCKGFDAKETNEKDNDWNAFFYCVGDSENAANKLEIFTNLMKKDSFDCFGQLDSENHNVFYYALLNNVLIADYIIQNEMPANHSVSVNEWAFLFSKRLSKSKLTRTDIDRFLTDWKQYSTLDAKHKIYYEIKSNLERMN